jgi:hypothetical protein
MSEAKLHCQCSICTKVYAKLQAELDSVSAEWRVSFDATIEQSAIISQQADKIERLKELLGGAIGLLEQYKAFFEKTTNQPHLGLDAFLKGAYHDDIVKTIEEKDNDSR